jgi:type II secretory pathway component GspD/PulD (secretin)
MRQSQRLSSGLAILIGLMLIPATLAQDARLQLAKGLFEMQEYEAAQETLLEIERDQLSEDEAEEYDNLLKILPTAIKAGRKAEQDMADANKAYEAGHWKEADSLYTRVVDNEYARTALRERARTQKQRIVEKIELSEAAKPVGPVPEQPVAEPQEPAVKPEAKPQAQPAAEPQDEPPAKPEAKAEPEKKPEAPPTAPRRRTLVDELRARDDLLWQRAEAKMKEAVQKAGEAVATDRFDEARQLADGALQVIEANRIYAQPPSRYEAARATALELRKSVKAAYDDFSRRMADRQREDVKRQIDERRRREERQRQEKVEQLFNTARQLFKEQRFREAAEAMRQVLVLDPANAKARFWLDNYSDYASLFEQKEVAREILQQTQLTLQQADESRIPWGSDILYPKNWLEIVARRAGIEGSGGMDEDFELNRLLESTQEEINFEEQPFDQVIDFLTDLNQMNIAVDWADLEHNVGFAVAEGLLRIATKEKLDRNKFILVYDIRDLIVNIPRFAKAPLIDATGLGSGDLGTVDLTRGSGSLFGSQGGALLRQAEREVGLDQPGAEEIMDIVRQTVEPDSWRETGGGGGALRELNGQLIVYNTSEAHQQTRALLSQLREARALMIGVESRFLLVSSNFLEEIGVDLDFVFNSGTAGFDPAFTTGTTGGLAPILDPFTGAQVLIPRAFSQIGIVPAVPPVAAPAMGQALPLQPFGAAGYVPSAGGIVPQSQRLTPITAQQSSLNLADPRALNTGIPGTFAREGLSPALNIAGSFLDNLQVDFLIRATQANRRSSIVQAPRLMMFNGQRAWIAVTRNRQYVSSVTPSVAESAVGVQPVIQVAASGSTLDVEGTISADRKYVTITVRSGQANEPSFERFEVQRASGNSPGIFILLTDQERTGIRTTVSVPDGGTVLLGGLKQVGEIEVEAGVPILSKIPILKRAFTNTTMVKDTQTLLILLKAKILIQKEAEEEAFPTLSALQPG